MIFSRRLSKQLRMVHRPCRRRVKAALKSDLSGMNQAGQHPAQREGLRRVPEHRAACSVAQGRTSGTRAWSHHRSTQRSLGWRNSCTDSHPAMPRGCFMPRGNSWVHGAAPPWSRVLGTREWKGTGFISPPVGHGEGVAVTTSWALSCVAPSPLQWAIALSTPTPSSPLCLPTDLNCPSNRHPA